jgi:damage-control phosphatase, subfamily II, stand-alone protein
MQVSQEVAAIAQDVGLIVLEGMGRSIETNLNARFSVDALKLGMIKHPEVAAELGGRLYDIVCKFDAAS